MSSTSLRRQMFEMGTIAMTKPAPPGLPCPGLDQEHFVQQHCTTTSSRIIASTICSSWSISPKFPQPALGTLTYYLRTPLAVPPFPLPGGLSTTSTRSSGKASESPLIPPPPPPAAGNGKDAKHCQYHLYFSTGRHTNCNCITSGTHRNIIIEI